MNNIPINLNTFVNNLSVNDINSFVQSDFARNLQLTYGLDSTLFNKIIADLFKYLSLENNNAKKPAQSDTMDLPGQFNVGENDLMTDEELKDIKEITGKDVAQYIAIFNYKTNDGYGSDLSEAFSQDSTVSEINKDLVSKLFSRDLLNGKLPSKNDVLSDSKVVNLLLEDSVKEMQFNSQNVANMSVKSNGENINSDVNSVQNSIPTPVHNGNTNNGQNMFIGVNEFLKAYGLKISDTNNAELRGKTKLVDTMKNDYTSYLVDNVYSDKSVNGGNMINSTNDVPGNSVKIVDNVANVINDSISKLSTNNQNEINLKIHLTSSDMVSVDVKLHNNTVNVNIDTNNPNIGQLISSNIDVLKNNLHMNNFSLGTVSVNVSGGFTHMNDGYKKNKQVENNEYVYVTHKKNNNVTVPKIRNLEVVV